MSSFCKCKSYSHFFSKNIRAIAIFNDQSFNDTLTNNTVSFKQLGTEVSHVSHSSKNHDVYLAPDTGRYYHNIFLISPQKHIEGIVMNTHNICLHEEIRKIYCEYPFLSGARHMHHSR